MMYSMSLPLSAQLSAPLVDAIDATSRGLLLRGHMLTGRKRGALLELDLGAALLDLLLDVRGLVLGRALLDRDRRRLDHALGLLRGRKTVNARRSEVEKGAGRAP